MPVKILITEGTRADCKETVYLIEGISVEVLLTDRGVIILYSACLRIIWPHFGYPDAKVKSLLENSDFDWQKALDTQSSELKAENGITE